MLSPVTRREVTSRKRNQRAERPCGSGQRSYNAANLLRARGQAVRLDG